LVALLNIEKRYTFITFLSTGCYIFILSTVVKAGYLGMFYISYVVVLLPFTLINGILTGKFISEPVVLYNDQENLGIKIFTIPIEDTVYGLLLILMEISIFEFFREKNQQNLNNRLL